MQKALQALLARAELVPVVFSYRQSSRHPGDDMVVDCAMNGRAVVVTSNIKDFREAAERVCFELVTQFSRSFFLNKVNYSLIPHNCPTKKHGEAGKG